MVKKIKYRWRSLFRRLMIVVQDNERKNIFIILIEFLNASLKNKCLATHYFTSFLYKRRITNYLDYISHKEGRSLQSKICDDITFAIQGNKLFFHRYFEKFNLPLTTLLAYNIKEKMFINNNDCWEQFEIRTEFELFKSIKKLLDISACGAIFMKPMVGSEGVGNLKIQQNLDNHLKSIVVEKFDIITKNSYVFEDVVVQHKDLSTINKSTLNTLRIDTFKALNKDPEIISAYLRVGRSISFVDNLAAGGYRVGIDEEKGLLRKFATTKIDKGVKFQTFHTDTGVEFEGIKIPFFQEAKELALAAANFLPQSLVGWDIGISNKGPLIIECNSKYYDMVGADIAYGGYRNNPVFQKVQYLVR